MTLTEKRVRSKVQALAEKCCDTYDQVVSHRTPSPKFWQLVCKHDETLGEKLAKRPITALEIDAACNVFHREFFKLCGRVKR